MTRTSKALKRLGVAGLVAVTIGAGLPALVGSAAQAAGPVTNVDFTSTDNQAAAGSCLAITAKATDATGTAVPGATITVSISDSSTSATQDVNFCTASTTTGTTTYQPQTGTAASSQGPTAGGGSTDVSVFTADADGNVTFGVTAVQPGSVFVRAFYDANNDKKFTAGEPQDTQTVTFTSGGAPGSNTNQDAAKFVTATPATDQAVVGETRTYVVNVLNGSNDALTGVRVSYQTTPGATGQAQSFSATDCGTTNNDGNAICTVKFTTAGNDDITFYVNQSGITSTPGVDTGEPRDTVAVSVVAAPTGRKVDITPSSQTVSQTQTSATFTVTVDNSATGGSPTTGTLLAFTVSGGSGDETVTGSGTTNECATAASTGTSSTCVITVKDPTPVSGTVLTVTATIRGTNQSDTSTLTFVNQVSDARNITLTPATATTTPGTFRTFTAKVVDAAGQPVAGVTVQFTESGAGAFRSGSSSEFVVTDASGNASVDVTSGATETGTQTITATISNTGTQCSQAAGAGTTPTGGTVKSTQTAGNCSATATNTFGQQSPSNGPPSTPPGCATAGAQNPNLQVRVNTPTINATGLASVTITGAQAGQVIEVQGYSQNHYGTANFNNDPTPVDRTVTADSNGSATINDLRPASNTRVRARQRGCAFGNNGAVINVRTQITLQVTRTGVRTYRFSGRTIPARPGGLIVSLYRGQSEVLFRQTRATAGTDAQPQPAGAGLYSITVTFPLSQANTRQQFVVKTGQDAQNAPGRSNTRFLSIF